MKDITCIFLTVNKVPEKWAEYQMKTLKEAIEDSPLITVSREPMEGVNLIQTGEINASNIYRQMLRAAKIAATPFVAIAEDDSLYPKEHFAFRPKKNEFAYNMSRWATLMWGKPMYFWRNRISNLTLIAPRELLIKCLEERFAKYPNGTPEYATGELGKERVERRLGLPHYNFVQFYTIDPIVNFNHEFSIDPYEKKRVKRPSNLRAFDIPKWGRVDQLIKNFQ